jgi:hypothetical protein
MTLYIMPIGRVSAMAAVAAAPDDWRVKVEAPKRTLPQNDAIHPLVRRIAISAGRPTTEDALRRLRFLFLDAWRQETGRKPEFELSLDGMRMVNVTGGTSDLDRPDCSEFIDWLHAWAAQHMEHTE